MVRLVEVRMSRELVMEQWQGGAQLSGRGVEVI